jgi:hypothetical protein
VARVVRRAGRTLGVKPQCVLALGVEPLEP